MNKLDYEWHKSEINKWEEAIDKLADKYEKVNQENSELKSKYDTLKYTCFICLITVFGSGYIIGKLG